MLSKSKIKQIQSLNVKKYRQKYSQFTVEGAKSVKELLNSDLQVVEIFATDKWEDTHPMAVIVDEKELKTISNLSTPPTVIAWVKMPDYTLELSKLKEKLTIALDNIQDPGNLGTIIRIADWYGIEHIICSPDSVDLYNPKVINATMGSFTRVKVFYADLAEVFTETKLPVYGTLLEGENIHQMAAPKEGIILIGNEGKGISKELLPLVTKAVSIPRFGEAESLNAAIATAVVIDNFRR